MDLWTFKWVSALFCMCMSLAGESQEVSLRDSSCYTSEPITPRLREDRGGGKSGKHRGSHGLLRVVDLGRIDTDSVLMWQLSVQHGRRAAPLGMCFVYKQTAPRRPGKRSVPADCRLQAANCHLVPARNYSGLRRVGHFTNLIVSNHSNLWAYHYTFCSVLDLANLYL